MNPQHTVSLELSKKLKGAGYPQEGEFWWVCLLEHETSQPIRYMLEPKGKYPSCLSNEVWTNEEDNIVAPLASEILERLSDTQVHYYLMQRYGIATTQSCLDLMRDINEIAKMYLYLAEQGLLGQ
jgi:hypothetical protein